MDILRVLSRGIKQNPKNKPQTAGTPAQLPSAGALTHPQLFHDPVSARGKKRKRRGSQVDETEGQADEELSDVDYFAPKKPATDAVPAAATADETPKKRKLKLLDEDECRQILRSHRLKFTVLSGRRPAVEKAEAEGEPAKKKKQKKDKKDKDADTHARAKAEQIFPQPLTSFADLRHTYDVSPQLAANIAAQGFRVPTEVQLASLPLLLRPATALKKAKGAHLPSTEGGADFLAVAPTGSGKTITFLIPAIDGVLRRRAERGAGSDEHVLEAVVVAPTRELASQIVNEGRKLAIGTGVRVVLMKRTLRLVAEEVARDKKDDEEHSGGEEEEEEEEETEDESDAEKPNKGDKPPARADILVTTPKMLLNFLSGKPGARRTLPAVRSLILDEADVLLDPIFRKQTLGIWRACTHPDVGLTCWSATMASNVESLLAKQLERRSRADTPAPPRPLIRLVVGLKDTAVPNITHRLVYTATEPGKLLALRQLLRPSSSADSGPPLRPPFLVFAQTIDRAQALHDELRYDIPLEAGGSARVAVLHAALPDRERARIMARFRAGEVWVLITTDVLARGVDFAGVNGVVNYDVPTSAAGYVHRAGRTGRAGREGGVAVTFYTKEDVPFVKSVANVIAASEKQAGKREGAAVQKWLLDALPDVAKEEKRKLKVRGVESRRTGGKAAITTKSSWERRREHNKAQAIEASKRRKKQQKEVADGGADGEAEWGGLEE